METRREVGKREMKAGKDEGKRKTGRKNQDGAENEER